MALSVHVGGKVHSKRREGSMGGGRPVPGAKCWRERGTWGPAGLRLQVTQTRWAVSAKVQESSGSASGFELRRCPAVKGKVGENGRMDLKMPD